ncbi:MAG: DUF4147 domain-containing protein [Patescibacteria group bacterium]
MSFHIQNKKSLATTKPRQHALSILEAGLSAVETFRVMKRRVALKGAVLSIGRSRYRLDRYQRIFVIGIGKAAFEASKVLEKLLGKRIEDGVVLDVKGGRLKRLKTFVGTHPFPSAQNVRATAEIMGILKSADSRDLILTIVSGGGSALLCWPYKLECADIVNITRTLMSRGSTIEELNTVRKHLSDVQGGHFVRLAHPATVVGLIFSDVPGDDLSMVASGPTFLDSTSVKDAKRILKKYRVLQSCRLPKCELQETPKDPALFAHVRNHLLVSNVIATKAMFVRAKQLGYRPVLYSTTLSDEARDVGNRLAKLPNPGEAVIAAGETTVTVRGTGSGGRNQELVLGALEALPDNTLVLSCASDGVDNGPFAGALIDEAVRVMARRRHLDAKKNLQENNSSAFFRETKTYIRTGVTGMNVSDLMIALRTR